MQLLVTSVFRWTPRWCHLSQNQENQNKKEKLYTGRIRFFPTICTIGPIHYLLHKSHLQKKNKQKINQSEPFIACLPWLLRASSKYSDMMRLHCPGLWLTLQTKVHFFFFLKVGEGGDGQKQKRKSIQCSFSHGLSSNSSTLMTFVGIEGSGCSSTSDPNHFARPGGGLLPCLCELFVRWGPWFCKWGPGMFGCTVMRFYKTKTSL